MVHRSSSFRHDEGGLMVMSEEFTLIFCSRAGQSASPLINVFQFVAHLSHMVGKRIFVFHEVVYVTLAHVNLSVEGFRARVLILINLKAILGFRVIKADEPHFGGVAAVVPVEDPIDKLNCAHLQAALLVHDHGHDLFGVCVNWRGSWPSDCVALNPSSGSFSHRLRLPIAECGCRLRSLSFGWTSWIVQFEQSKIWPAPLLLLQSVG